MKRASFCYRDRFIESILFISIFGAIIAISSQTKALESVLVPPNADAIDLTRNFEVYWSQGDQIELQSAPDEKGIVRRFVVSSVAERSNPKWYDFSLKNKSDRTLNRVISFHHEGSNNFPAKLLWPKLAKSVQLSSDKDTEPKRLSNIQKDKLADADVFRIRLKPFSTSTFVAEIHGVHNQGKARVLLWSPEYLNDADIWEVVRDQHTNRRIALPYVHLLAHDDDTASMTFKLVKIPGGAALADTRFVVRTREGTILADLFGAYPSLRLLKGDYILQAYRDDNVFAGLFTVRPQQERDVEILFRLPDSK